jgi:hypothetical protein
MLTPVLPSLQGQQQKSYLVDMLTDHIRREELKAEFLEFRSKMQEIYRSWNVLSCDQVG